MVLLIALPGTGYILLQSPKVQTYIIKKIAIQLSRKSNAKISIGKVDIAFFKKVILNDVLIAEPNNDTIFYSQWVSAKIDSFSLKKHRLSIGELDYRGKSGEYNS